MPYSSVAVHTTVVVPNLNELLFGKLLVNVMLEEQPSVTIGLLKLIRAGRQGEFTTVSEPQLITGGVMSVVNN